MNKRTLILTGAAILLVIAAVFSIWKEKQDLLTEFYGDPPREDLNAEDLQPEPEPKKPRSKKAPIVEPEIQPTDGTAENQ
jgi:hypothetical protein